MKYKIVEFAESDDSKYYEIHLLKKSKQVFAWVPLRKYQRRSLTTAGDRFSSLEEARTYITTINDIRNNCRNESSIEFKKI